MCCAFEVGKARIVVGAFIFVWHSINETITLNCRVWCLPHCFCFVGVRGTELLCAVPWCVSSGKICLACLFVGISLLQCT